MKKVRTGGELFYKVLVLTSNKSFLSLNRGKKIIPIYSSRLPPPIVVRAEPGKLKPRFFVERYSGGVKVVDFQRYSVNVQLLCFL